MTSFFHRRHYHFRSASGAVDISEDRILHDFLGGPEKASSFCLAKLPHFHSDGLVLEKFDEIALGKVSGELMLALFLPL